MTPDEFRTLARTVFGPRPIARTARAMGVTDRTLFKELNRDRVREKYALALRGLVWDRGIDPDKVLRDHAA